MSQEAAGRKPRNVVDSLDQLAERPTDPKPVRELDGWPAVLVDQVEYLEAVGLRNPELARNLVALFRSAGFGGAA